MNSVNLSPISRFTDEPKNVLHYFRMVFDKLSELLKI
jgi:hypothetical protein